MRNWSLLSLYVAHACRWQHSVKFNETIYNMPLVWLSNLIQQKSVKKQQDKITITKCSTTQNQHAPTLHTVI